MIREKSFDELCVIAKSAAGMATINKSILNATAGNYTRQQFDRLVQEYAAAKFPALPIDKAVAKVFDTEQRNFTRCHRSGCGRRLSVPRQSA
jgi:hypothetical protein